MSSASVAPAGHSRSTDWPYTELGEYADQVAYHLGDLVLAALVGRVDPWDPRNADQNADASWLMAEAVALGVGPRPLWALLGGMTAAAASRVAASVLAAAQVELEDGDPAARGSAWWGHYLLAGLAAAQRQQDPAWLRRTIDADMSPEERLIVAIYGSVPRTRPSSVPGISHRGVGAILTSPAQLIEFMGEAKTATVRDWDHVSWTVRHDDAGSIEAEAASSRAGCHDPRTGRVDLPRYPVYVLDLESESAA